MFITRTASLRRAQLNIIRSSAQTFGLIKRKTHNMENKDKTNNSESITKDESEWKAILSPVQFAVLREKATERPNTGVYNHFDKEGIYDCAGCGQPLYKSTTKFNSGCGWPAFYQGIPGAIKTETDTSFGRTRTEIMCSKCGGHLGHVFKGEGFKTPTDERHCVNSISLKFKPVDE